MPLQFIGIDPTSGDGESPTVWRYSETGDLLVQSYRATADEVSDCQKVGSVPGHSADIPAHETVIRIPARMIPILKEACDANPDLG